MKKNKLIYAILVLLFLFLMIMYDGWQTEVLFLLVVALPIIFGIVAFYCSRNIKVYFDEVEEYCQRENHIKKYVMVKNDTQFAIPRIELRVCIEDYMGQKAYRTLVVNSESYTIRNFAMEMAFEHYGMMTIRLEKVKVYDYLGVFAFQKKPKLETIIYVFPDYSEKVHFTMASLRREEGVTQELQYGRKGTDRSEVMENDEYHEGDDIRNIHWKLSSKSDTLIVKHFGEQKEENVNIYVDLKVDKNTQYESGDGILSALYAVVSACEQRGFPYKIWGCSGDELIAADLRNVITGISERNDESNGYQCVSQIRKLGGTGICITTADIEANRIDQPVKCVDYYWRKENKEAYDIEGDTLFKVVVEPKDKSGKDFFIRENNDKLRTHQKIDYHQYCEKYLPLQAGIALLASLISVLSIFDVIYIHLSGVIQAMFVVLFVVFHYIAYYLTMEEEESVRKVRLRTILILCGYAAVVLIAGPGNLIEGVRSIVDLFQETLVARGNYYGFLEFNDPYINWLLLLVAYAVVDVIFNFCADFVLGIHLLVVVPLLSICMIVGSMPPTTIAFLAGIYLPVLAVVHNSIRHGRSRKKKYLSDDYLYTGNIAVSVGVFAAIVSAVVLVVATLLVHVGGYETPAWIRKSKKTITKLMDIDNWNELLSVRTFGDTLLTEESNGWLDDTKKVEYTGETVLEVVVSREVSEGFYLKEYAGTHYNEKAWLERSQTEIQEERDYMSSAMEAVGYDDLRTYYNGEYDPDPYGVAEFRELLTYHQILDQYSGLIKVWAGDVLPYEMTIEMTEEPEAGIPHPYYSILNYPYVIWGDGYIYGLQDGNGKKYEFTGLYAEGCPDISGIREKYGEYPYVEMRRDETQKRRDLEGYYSLWVESNYLEVVPELEDEMEQFLDVRTVCGSEEYHLIAGDRQFMDIGYEPYIQYVRKFFQDQGYVYNLHVTRKNNYNDFISDFMKRKTGYCIHYASTAVMMFRTMGIPARYAEGYYVTEEYNAGAAPGGKRYVVPDSAAHAWVEIYCQGAGWVPVEVTPGSNEFIVEPEKITTTEPLPTTTQHTDTTKLTTQKTTKTPQQVTSTTEKPTVKVEQKAPAKKLSDYWELLIPVVLVMMVLIHYQWKTERLRKRLCNGKRHERMKAMDAYFVTVTRNSCKGWKEYETNDRKAEYLMDEMPMENVSEDDILKILEILDKIRYAPEGSVTDEELTLLYEFLTAYGKTGYEQGKVQEKFAYKYIKCLYLKDK